MKYTVVHSPNPGMLAKDVNFKLEEGWELYGSACTAENRIFQPMILSNEAEARMRGDPIELVTKRMPNP